MKIHKIKHAVPFFSLLLTACAVTPLDSGARNVRVISDLQAKGCRFLDKFTSNNTNTLSKNPEQDARNRAFNRVATLGGNSLRIVSSSTHVSRSGVGSIYTMDAEAYECR